MIASRLSVATGHDCGDGRRWRDRRIEHHSTKQLRAILLWTNGPAITTQITILGVQHRERADETQTEVAIASSLSIEALEHQDVAASDGPELRLASAQTALPGEIQCCELNPLQVETIGALRKPGEP
jgi:hypothetical protein